MPVCMKRTLWPVILYILISSAVACLGVEPSSTGDNSIQAYPVPSGKTPYIFEVNGQKYVGFADTPAPNGTPETSAASPVANAKPAHQPAAAASAAASPSSPHDIAESLLDKVNFDRPIGEIPAFTALDLSPDTV